LQERAAAIEVDGRDLSSIQQSNRRHDKGETQVNLPSLADPKG